MAQTYDRRINLYINGREVRNNMASIRKETYKVTNELAQMTRGTEAYKRKAAEIRQLKSIMAKHQAEIRGTTAIWQKAKNVLSNILPVAGIAGVVAAFANYTQKIREAVEAYDNFEERLDNLSALTGLKGSELEKLGDIAKKTSVKITDGNVRIKQSADDIVDAYTKVGSQRPELLKNAEALASVTEDAIILSEAAKSDLEPAVAGLTTTMNQFNLGAEHSRRIINAMAAGSKEGAADIPYLTQAIEKSGTTMNLMNVSLEENIGLIEAIAPNFSKAEMAGNSLDKVFLKMKAGQIGYKDGVFSVDAALAELQKRFANGETAVELFGVEHAKMAELLVQNRAEVDRYTKAVTGTNIAIEQAAKNTNNAKAIQAQARNEWKLMSIELGQKLSPAMSSVIKASGSLASALTRLISTKGSEKLRMERIEMNNLFTAIKHAKEGSDERKKAIEELNTTYSKYLPNLLTEKSTLVEIQKVQRGANNELLRNIQLKLKEEELEVLARKQKDIMDNILSDVGKRRGKSLVPAAESEIFSLLSEMENMTSVDEAKNKLGAFAKVYRDASKNIGTYTENINQFYELFRIGKDQQALLDSINKIAVTPYNEDTVIGTRKTVGLIVYEWDGKEWKEVDRLQPTPTGGSGNSRPDITTVDEVNIIDEKQMEFDALKAMEADYTDFVNNEVNKQIDILAKQYNLEKEIADARIALKDIQVAAVGEVASSLASMFEQGSAAQIAMIAVEKAIAIAQIWINYAREMSAISLASANIAAMPIPGARVAAAAYMATMSTKAKVQAGINTGIIVAQTVSSAVSSGKRKKTDAYATGGYTRGEAMYIAGEAGKEWIAPNRMINHPVTGPIIAALENMRNSKLSPSALQTFASGGFTASSGSTANSQLPLPAFSTAGGGSYSDPALLAKLDEVADTIRNLKIYTAIEDIKKGDKKYTEIQNTRGL